MKKYNFLHIFFTHPQGLFHLEKYPLCMVFAGKQSFLPDCLCFAKWMNPPTHAV